MNLEVGALHLIRRLLVLALAVGVAACAVDLPPPIAPETDPDAHGSDGTSEVAIEVEGDGVDATDDSGDPDDDDGDTDGDALASLDDGGGDVRDEADGGEVLAGEISDASVTPDSDAPACRCDLDPGCSCDDANPCTLDSCEAGACLNTPRVATACDDADPCTLADACSALGFCVGSPMVCVDAGATLGVCAGATGCMQVAASDDIDGVPVARSQGWWTEAGLIYHGRVAVELRGVSWFGLETVDNALHGLWTGRTIADFLGQVRGLGFNALRIPVSPLTLDASAPPALWAQQLGWSSGREILEALLQSADELGVDILLDLHTCDPAVGIEAGFPTDCPGYRPADWHDTLVAMADLALAHPHVIGIEPFNEPHRMSWSSWAAQAEIAGALVLATNPHLLVFIQGVAGLSNVGPAEPAWGENLVSAGVLPVELPTSRRVYAPHIYGPSVHQPKWSDRDEYVFADEDFPESTVAVWEAHFGYLIDLGLAVVPTEFGDWYDEARAAGGVVWMDRLVLWMAARPMRSYFYWSLNPNSMDTGGLLLDDWRTPDLVRLEALGPILRP